MSMYYAVKVKLTHLNNVLEVLDEVVEELENWTCEYDFDDDYEIIATLNGGINEGLFLSLSSKYENVLFDCFECCTDDFCFNGDEIHKYLFINGEQKTYRLNYLIINSENLVSQIEFVEENTINEK